MNFLERYELLNVMNMSVRSLRRSMPSDLERLSGSGVWIRI